MSLLTLHTPSGTLLASDRLVYAPDEVADLLRAGDLVAQLDQLVVSEQERLDSAQQRVEATARADGYEHGLRSAKDATAAKLLELEAARQRDVAELRSRTTALALEIVRRVAGDVAPADWLAAQACRAAEDLMDQAPLNLRVHPDHAVGVRERLALSAPLFVDVLADDTLDPADCIIDSRVGSVDASLESQLQCLASLDLAMDVEAP